MQYMKYGTAFRSSLIKKKNFSFLKEFLNGNEIEESICWERLRSLEIEGKIDNKPSQKKNSFFLQKINPLPLLILEIYPKIRFLVASLAALNIQRMIYLSLVKKMRLWIE